MHNFAELEQSAIEKLAQQSGCDNLHNCVIHFKQLKLLQPLYFHNSAALSYRN